MVGVPRRRERPRWRLRRTGHGGAIRARAHAPHLATLRRAHRLIADKSIELLFEARHELRQLAVSRHVEKGGLDRLDALGEILNIRARTFPVTHDAVERLLQEHQLALLLVETDGEDPHLPRHVPSLAPVEGVHGRKTLGADLLQLTTPLGA